MTGRRKDATKDVSSLRRAVYRRRGSQDASQPFAIITVMVER